MLHSRAISLNVAFVFSLGPGPSCSPFLALNFPNNHIIMGLNLGKCNTGARSVVSTTAFLLFLFASRYSLIFPFRSFLYLLFAVCRHPVSRILLCFCSPYYHVCFSVYLWCIYTGTGAGCCCLASHRVIPPKSAATTARGMFGFYTY